MSESPTKSLRVYKNIYLVIFINFLTCLMNGILLQVKVLFNYVDIVNKFFPHNIILNIIYRKDNPNHNEMYEETHKKYSRRRNAVIFNSLGITLENEGSEYYLNRYHTYKKNDCPAMLAKNGLASPILKYM